MHKVLYIKKCGEKENPNPFRANQLKNITIDSICIKEVANAGAEYELYLAEIDFSDKDYTEKLSELINQNQKVDFWAVTENCQKEQIVSSYNLGFKNVLSLPIEKEVFEQYFVKDEDLFEEEFQESFDENITIIKNSDVLIVDDNPMNIMLLKQSDINKHSPVVFISALNETENKIQGYNLGSYAYIEKPFDINTLRAQVLNILKIQKLQEEKETFIATLTHDLKTPIRAQIRALDLLLNNKFGELEPLQHEIVREIFNSCKFMAHMTDNLLTRYKYDNGQLKIRKEVSSFKKLIEETGEKLKYLIEPKNQILKIVYTTEVDEFEFDAIEIGRVITNLITNASEYSENDSQITLQVETEDNYLKVSVIDSGTGIGQQELENLFAKYMTDAKKFRKVGFGLGLYVSKKIVEGHQGTICVESEQGKGSKFIFRLPLTESFVAK